MRLLSVSASLGAILVLAGCGATGTSHFLPASSAIPPVVLGTGMQTNGVGTNRAIDVQFNTAMNAASINSQTFLLTKASGGIRVPGTVTYDPTNFVALFKPSAPLAANTSYSATLTTGATSASGARIAANYTFSFTTRDGSDSSPIGVYETIPAAFQTAVSVDTSIKIVFTEGADPTTVNPNTVFVAQSNGSTVLGTVTYDIVTNYATFTPSSPLLPGTIYYVSVSNVTDLAGNAMPQQYSFSFTTAGSPPQVQDLLYEADPTLGTISGWIADIYNAKLTPIPGSPFPSGLEPVQMIPSPNGSTLYVIMGEQPVGVRGSNCFAFNAQVYSYSINHTTGALTQESQLTLNGFCAQMSSAIDPTGHFLFVGQSSGSGSSGLVDAISLSSAGQMALVTGSPFASPEPMASLVLDGNYLYAAGTNGLATFQRNPSTGAVQFLATTPLPPQASLVALPSGSNLYSVDATGAISEFQVNSATGGLSLEASLPPIDVVGTPYNNRLIADPQGHFIYLSSSLNVSTYSVSASGTLEFIDQLFNGAASGTIVFDTTDAAYTLLGFSQLYLYAQNDAGSVLLAQTPGTANPGSLTMLTK
jgi:hypothetical protein